MNEVTPALLTPPMGLNRSGIACWWSILNLVQTDFPCYLWTLTTAETLPHSYYGEFHKNLMRDLGHKARDGFLPKNWGGVRVVEVHPNGHGLHFHWVMRGYLPIKVVRDCTTRAGFGRIHVDPDPVSPKAASYLAKYLTKGERIFGVRAWACIGNYDGVKTRDVEFDSDTARVFRRVFRAATDQGYDNRQAFIMARLCSTWYEANPEIPMPAERLRDGMVNRKGLTIRKRPQDKTHGSRVVFIPPDDANFPVDKMQRIVNAYHMLKTHPRESSPTSSATGADGVRGSI